MKRLFIFFVLFFAAVQAHAGKISTGNTQPATCTVGDIWIKSNGATDNRIYACTATNTYTLQNTKPWVIQSTAPANTGLIWFDDDQEPGYLVQKVHNGTTWVAQTGSSYTLPTATADTLGGVKIGSRLSISDGVLSADVQSTDISGKENSLGNPSTNGYVLSSTTGGTRSWVANGSGSMVYPGAGVPNSTGSAWGTSYAVGTSANNLVQLNASAQLPAVSAALLTNFPTLNQNTTGTSAGLSGTPNITVGTISAGAAGFSVDDDGDVTAKSFTSARSTTTGSYMDLPEGSNNGDHRVRIKASDSLAADIDIVADALITTASFDDTPDNGSTTTGPTSNWAYDHAALAMSDTVVGHVEAATTAETNTGTSTTLAVTPDGLSGSVYGQKEIGWVIKKTAEDTAVADGTDAIVIPASMNGMNLVDLTCSVASLNSAASGSTTVVLRRVRGATAVDMTSTGVTIAYNEYTASDETVDTSNDDVQTGDMIYADVNAVTSAVQKGLSCTAVLQTP